MSVCAPRYIREWYEQEVLDWYKHVEVKAGNRKIKIRGPKGAEIAGAKFPECPDYIIKDSYLKVAQWAADQATRPASDRPGYPDIVIELEKNIGLVYDVKGGSIAPDRDDWIHPPTPKTIASGWGQVQRYTNLANEEARSHSDSQWASRQWQPGSSQNDPVLAWILKVYQGTCTELVETPSGRVALLSITYRQGGILAFQVMPIDKMSELWPDLGGAYEKIFLPRL